MTPLLAVIIPTLNEALTLPALLEDLRGQTGVTLEVWISDGGSDDATVSLARSAGAQVVSGAPGRGAQMNRAHARAQPSMRLFLHADSRLSRPDQLARALQAWQTAGGAASRGTFRCALSMHQRPTGGFLRSWKPRPVAVAPAPFMVTRGC